MAQKDLHEQPQVDFQPVETELVELNDEVLEDLSTDQRLLYEYVYGISKGRINQRYLNYKIGPCNHARWLTLAIRILSCYARVPIAIASIC